MNHQDHISVAVEQLTQSRIQVTVTVGSTVCVEFVDLATKETE